MAPDIRELLLVGAGGLAREVADTVRAINGLRPTWELLGFVDDDPCTHGTVIAGLPVLGALDAVHDHPAAQVVLCAARAEPDAARHPIRRVLAERLGLDDGRYATVIHPSATIGSTCRIGGGTVLLAHVDLTADVVLGRHVVVMPQVVLTHDVRIDDWATLASGVRLGGGCHVEPGAYIGAGASVREMLTVGAGAMIGMGSVVTHHVPSGQLWFGVPARDHARAQSERAGAAGAEGRRSVRATHT